MQGKNDVEELLAYATKVEPIRRYNTPKGEMGVYILGNIMRDFLIADVQRKRCELDKKKKNDSFYAGKVDPLTMDDEELI